jgi:hypothetical protein
MNTMLGKTHITYKPKRRRVSLSSAAWKRLRAQVLAEEPLCRWCAARGLVVPATDVDHIEDSRDDYTDDNSRENLAPMCHECHSLKTAASMGKRVALGCDASGLPVDPNHHWNRPEKSPATAGESTAPPLLFDC